MSFVDKLTTLMARPGGENAQKDDVSWWMRTAGRGLGTFGGFMAIIFGLFNCLTLSISCLLAGIWMMCAGFVLLVCEAPCCCFFIDYVQVLSDKLEGKPYWQKAAFYIGLSLPPYMLCFLSVSTILGSSLILGTGVVYGMMALGKKASVDDMRTAAANIEAGQPSTATRANLVTNEQPVSFTGAPSVK